jgi:hypothetical protein
MVVDKSALVGDFVYILKMHGENSLKFKHDRKLYAHCPVWMDQSVPLSNRKWVSDLNLKLRQ